MLKDISNSLSIRPNNTNSLEVKRGFATSNVKRHSVSKERSKNRKRISDNENRGQSSQTEESPASFQLKEKPSYRFPQLFKTINDKLFPFIGHLHRKLLPASATKERVVNLIPEVHFSRNATRKYKCAFKDDYHYVQASFQESNRNVKNNKGSAIVTNKKSRSHCNKMVDPTDKIFTSAKNSKNLLGFDRHQVAITSTGSCEHKVKEDLLLDDQETTLGSKRSFSVLESSSADTSAITNNRNTSKMGNLSAFSTSNISVSSNLDSGSPLTTKRLKVVSFKAPKKGLSASQNYLYNHERIDNSMTISAKAILKMVDDSLVSSDNSINSQSFANISTAQTPSTKSRKRQPVSINEADLQNVLHTDDYSNSDNSNADIVTHFSTPSVKKFRMLGPN